MKNKYCVALFFLLIISSYEASAGNPKIDSLLKVVQKMLDSTELNKVPLHISKVAGVKASILTDFSSNELYEYEIKKVNSTLKYANIFDNDYVEIENKIKEMSKEGWEIVDIKYVEPFKVTDSTECVYVSPGNQPAKQFLYINDVKIKPVDNVLRYKHNNQEMKCGFSIGPGQISQQNCADYSSIVKAIREQASSIQQTVVVFRKRKYISDKTLDHLITNINQKIDLELDTKLNNFNTNEIEVIKTTLESFLHPEMTESSKKLVKEYVEESIKLYFLKHREEFKNEIIKEIKETLKP